MHRTTDRAYLTGRQYRDSSNLDARLSLHRRFSTNRHDWPEWVFERMALAPGLRVLELGSGSAALWQANRDRLPAGCAITLSDFSDGMQRSAREQLGPLAQRFAWEIIDAQAIPHDDQSFDVVIANHMLYHVPDRTRAIGEIYRVLRPDGRLYAATNGAAHLRELAVLLRSVVPEIQVDDTAEIFSLENGARQLHRHFARVSLAHYPDALNVTATEPLIRYILSIQAADWLDDQRIAQLRSAIEAEITTHGSFHITKSVGLFTATS